jgi:phage gp46-like protein
MSDIALVLSSDGLSADLAVENGDLVMDDGLDTAALISLFTDRRADADDPVDPRDPFGARGWAGDLLAQSGDRIGSRLWLLERATLPTDVRFGGALTAAMVQQYAAEALAWMIEDGVAASVTPKAWVPKSSTFGPSEAIALLNAIAQGTKTRGKWKFVWAAQAAKSSGGTGN